MNKKTGMTIFEKLVALFILVVLCVAGVSVYLLDATGKKGSGLGKDYTYNIDEMAKVDTALILYVEVQKAVVTGLTSSTCIASDSTGNIYVGGDNNIVILDNNLKQKTSFKVSASPKAMAFGEDQKLYVAMKDHVEVYDSAFKILKKWQTLGERAVLTSIAVSENNVFVADAANKVVVRYDLEGNIINYIGKKNKDRNIPGFVIPSPYFDLAIAGDGLLRVVNPGMHRIEAYTFDGDLEFWWGNYSTSLDGFVGCCNPVNFAILSDGSFVTCEKGLTRVKLYDPEGNFEGVVASPKQLHEHGPWRICDLPEDCQKGGFDIAVGTDDNVYVLDTIHGSVRMFTRIKKDR